MSAKLQIDVNDHVNGFSVYCKTCDARMIISRQNFIERVKEHMGLHLQEIKDNVTIVLTYNKEYKHVL